MRYRRTNEIKPHTYVEKWCSLHTYMYVLKNIFEQKHIFLLLCEQRLHRQVKYFVSTYFMTTPFIVHLWYITKG